MRWYWLSLNVVLFSILWESESLFVLDYHVRCFIFCLSSKINECLNCIFFINKYRENMRSLTFEVFKVIHIFLKQFYKNHLSADFLFTVNTMFSLGFVVGFFSPKKYGFCPGLFLSNTQLWNTRNKTSCHVSPFAYVCMSLIAVIYFCLMMIKLVLRWLQRGTWYC